MSTACRSAKTRSGWFAGDTGDTAMVESKVCLCVFISHMYINKQYINIRNIYIYTQINKYIYITYNIYIYYI